MPGAGNLPQQRRDVGTLRHFRARWADAREPLMRLRDHGAGSVSTGVSMSTAVAVRFLAPFLALYSWAVDHQADLTAAHAPHDKASETANRLLSESRSDGGIHIDGCGRLARAANLSH